MGGLGIIAIALFLTVGNLIQNGGFEEGLEGWRDLWTRDPGVGRVALDDRTRHSGRFSARIDHEGERDWSLDPEISIDVKPGDLFELEAWVRIEGKGRTTLCVVTYDEEGKVLKWVYAGRSAYGPCGWRHLTSRFVVPRNVARIHPRLIGAGPATIWLDDFSLVKEGNVMEMRNENLPPRVSLSNRFISVTLRTDDGAMEVVDKRIGHKWVQKPLRDEMIIRAAKANGKTAEVDMIHAPSGLEVKLILRLEEEAPEFTVELHAEGEMSGPIPYPHPFVTEPPTYLVVPLNEGISYPVDDPSIEPMRLIAYGGHGICMAFWGVTDGGKAQMAIIETPDDAAIRITRLEGKLCIAPEWDPQKGKFGYPRRLRYVFLDKGGHVAICKRYRAYAKKIGLLKTLKEKLRENPNVDLLVGAVNVWYWGGDPLRIVEEMRELGIERILWSHREKPEVIRKMNEMGILTSRYDIYQDVMNPDNFKYLRGVHPDWPTEAWPDDIILGPDGDWIRGWRVKGKDGKWYPCGVLCDSQALKYARKRIPEDLKTHPYRCRFIDTTTASPWRECYHPKHPMTRSDSKRWRMELLRFVSEEMGLVCGSETGHDAAVPYLHYFEGMMSLGPYRVPDAGRNLLKIWYEVPERVRKFQVGHEYRLPLWELVYHDCVVSYWYWGDYNNKLPALWDKKDLFNILYGTPPMFMFTREFWEKHKERFAQSYRNICPIARAVGYAEMIDHRFLTPDRSVQQTVFSNGVVITVNFGDKPYFLPDGTKVEPMGFHVEGL
ncbi:hypothetical protein DRP77_02000 [Candidatus Poribacteria bacterium]|nr:MAG: hypothetical protein DRP77_02000 [Candidatus Poribacteria bacterium]